MTLTPTRPPAAGADRPLSALSLLEGRGHPSQLSRLHRPWAVAHPAGRLVVRRAVPPDLPGLVALHRRCSAVSLWQWHGRGGSAPTLGEAASWLAASGSLVAVTRGDEGSRLVARASLRPVSCGRTGEPWATRADVLVDDRWQGAGLGSALTRHLAAAAHLIGFRELVVPAGSDTEVAQQLLRRVGVVHAAQHPHGACARVRLGREVLAGLGPLRSGALTS